MMTNKVWCSLIPTLNCLVKLGILLFLYTATVQAGQITLTWDANTESILGGYKIYYGLASGSYTSNVDVGLKTTYTLANLQEGATYYFAVKAYDKAHTMESGFSNEISKNFGVTPPPIGPLPSPWLAMDIGNVELVGSASYTNGSFTLSGSGTDIWGTTDAFHYVYQPLNGNGQIVAQITNIANTSSWAKAGVMIRENLDANARHAMVVVTPGNGVVFQYRKRTGRSSYHTAGASVRAPYWVKLVRTGSTFTAYQSADGSQWAAIGSATINMATSVYIGLAVTSHNNSALNTVKLNNVRVQ